MANGNVRRRVAVGVAAAAAGVAGAGCGGGGGATPRSETPRAAAPRDAPPAPSTSRPVDLDPEVTGRQLLWLQRSGAQAGANDIVKFGSDGSAVVIQAYGGGGEKIRRCTLRADAVRRLRAGLAGLPLSSSPPVPKRKFVSIYVAGPARYTFVARRGDEHATFTDDAMPRDARPFVRLMEDTLYDRAADCRVTYRSKVS